MMETTLVAGLLFVLLAVGGAYGQSDPCTDFVNIGHEQRSTQYVLRGGESGLCDDFIDSSKWYSFEERSGSMIPELQIMDSNRCGTESPIYITQNCGATTCHQKAKNDYPSGVPVIIQSNTGEVYSSIVIMYCPARSVTLGHDAFVYKLQGKPTVTCNAKSHAYCAGDTPICPASGERHKEVVAGNCVCPGGQHWNAIQNKCVYGLPDATIPTLRGPEIARSAVVRGGGGQNITVRQFAFYCDINDYNATFDDGTRFKVVLVFDGVLYDNITVGDGHYAHRTVEIPETLLMGNFGKTLQCAIRGYWFSNGTNPVKSEPYLSNETFWIGIKPNTSLVEITDNVASKNRMATITYISTVPITCWHCYMNQNHSEQCFNVCTHAYNAKSDGVDVSDCVLHMTESKIFTLDVQVSMVFPQPVAYYYVSFKPFIDLPDFDPYVLWRGYVIPNVTVRFVQNKTQKQCSSVTDPHLTTLGNDKIDNYQTGDFTLLRSLPSVTTMNLQIQVRQVECNARASCICSVIVREYNSAIRIDSCNVPITNAAVASVNRTELLKPTAGSPSVIYPGESSLVDYIVMPSGLAVKVDRRSWFSVYVTLPGVYVDNVEGMCTEKINNSKAFRIDNDAQNMFVTPPTCESVNTTPFTCTCDIDSADGSDFQCTVGETIIPKTTGNVCDNPARKRRSTLSQNEMPPTYSDDYIDPNDVYGDMPYDPDFGKNTVVSWPTATGKTLQQAQQYCLQTLRQSTAFDSCAGMYNENALLSDCSSDVWLMDQFVGAEAFRSAMEIQCKDTVIKLSNVTSITEMNANSFVTNVTQNMCPNGCSGNGNCSDGKCHCAEGFIGSDCATNQNSPAVLATEHRVCNLNSAPCENTNVLATNVYENPSLLCRYRRFSLLDRTMQPLSVDISAKINAPGEVRCPSPKDVDANTGKRLSSGYIVTVSNDGLLFSNEMVLTVYDPACLTCQANGTCKQLANTCFIGSLCQSNGDRENASVSCMTCLPDQSPTQWTDTAVWTSWTDCSRSCDTGAIQRFRICANGEPTPSNFGTETETCSTKKCPGVPEERNEGVVITNSMTDTKVILANERKYFDEIADAVNTYCGSNSAVCCTALGLKHGSSTLGTMNVTLSSQCAHGASYPDVWSTPTRNKIIVRAYTTTVYQQCTGTNNIAAEIYFNQSIILEAVQQAETRIESALGITIMDVTRE